ncbi:Obg family GTPase CgtA [Patescibacteria group bacterium]
MLIDDVKISVSAGKGGNGVVMFSRTKFCQGPTGGDGGRGGNVILRGIADLGALKIFRTTKDVYASDGESGAQNTKTGSDGRNKIVLVPVGTVAQDLTNNREYEIVSLGQEVVIARGGNGGFGNHHFRSSRNTTPERANPGEAGDNIELRLELKLIADIGFVGYPNVGKSSLLNELTNASIKVANYKFTTLEPNLGVYYDLILADIPGIIEGASEGKGLGYKFLRHIERTKVLFHFVAADSEDPVKDYESIREELGSFNEELLRKPEYIIVSKSDEKSDEEIEDIIASLRKKNKNITSLTIIDEEGLSGVKRILEELQKGK